MFKFKCVDLNKSVLTVLRHSQWPIMFGKAFSGAGLRATGRAFRYIQPTLGNTQWTGPACWPAQCLHSASKSSKSKWYQEEFAKLSFCRSGMGTSACEVSCNDESRWESKSRSHGKRWAKRFERKQLEVFFCVCGFCGGELNTYQVHPSTISTFLWILSMKASNLFKLGWQTFRQKEICDLFVRVRRSPTTHQPIQVVLVGEWHR